MNQHGHSPFSTLGCINLRRKLPKTLAARGFEFRAVPYAMNAWKTFVEKGMQVPFPLCRI